MKLFPLYCDKNGQKGSITESDSDSVIGIIGNLDLVLKLLYFIEVRAWGTITERGKVFDDIKDNA